jgi:hypothetical protein
MKKMIILYAVAVLLLGSSLASATVDVYGQVRIYNGTCNTGIGMNGVSVILYDTLSTFRDTTVTYTDAAFMAAHNLTSPLGIYYFDDVPYSTSYKVEVILPLGVVTATDPLQGPWWNANPRIVGTDYYRCFLMVLTGCNFTPHTIGYWKHQAQVAVTGRGNPQVPAALLQEYLNRVYQLFDDEPNFPISGVSSVNGSPLTPQDMINTFNLPNGGSIGMKNKTKKQLLALLLNVAAEYVYPYQIISVDQRTVSQAIAFGADMITNNGSALSTAHSALDYINNGTVVPAGWIPGSYGLVYYGDPSAEPLGDVALPSSEILLANYPNPFNPTTTIRFNLPESGDIRLTVYDAAGREVATLFDGWSFAGERKIRFDASGLPSGVYFCRLASTAGNSTAKLMLVK